MIDEKVPVECDENRCRDHRLSESKAWGQIGKERLFRPAMVLQLLDGSANVMQRWTMLEQIPGTKHGTAGGDRVTLTLQ